MLWTALKGAALNNGLTFRSSATSTAATITVPNDVVAGDLLVLYDRAVNNFGNPTTVVPSDFSTIRNEAIDTTVRIICSYKIANGTEAGTNLTGMDGGSSDAKILMVFATNGATSGSVFDVDFEVTDANPAAQTVNVSGQPTPLVVLAFIRQQTATGQSFSPTQNGTVGPVNTNTGYYRIYNSSPADVTVDCDDGGNNNSILSFYLQVT
jgi:hypothetical protein